MELLMPDFGLLFWVLVAFIIVFIILKKYAWKPILASLKERETNIADSLAMAERAKAEMAQLKNENEALMAQAREERAQMMKEARETQNRIINESKEQAKVEAGRIISDAQAAIEHQKMAAMVELKNQVGILVVEVAEKVLRRELAQKSEQELYIKQLTDGLKLN